MFERLTMNEPSWISRLRISVLSVFRSTSSSEILYRKHTLVHMRLDIISREGCASTFR